MSLTRHGLSGCEGGDGKYQRLHLDLMEQVGSLVFFHAIEKEHVRSSMGESMEKSMKQIGLETGFPKFPSFSETHIANGMETRISKLSSDVLVPLTGM